MQVYYKMSHKIRVYGQRRKGEQGMEGEYADQQITDTVLSICKALTMKEPSP